VLALLVLCFAEDENRPSFLPALVTGSRHSHINLRQLVDSQGAYAGIAFGIENAQAPCRDRTRCVALSSSALVGANEDDIKVVGAQHIGGGGVEERVVAQVPVDLQLVHKAIVIVPSMTKERAYHQVWKQPAVGSKAPVDE